MSSRGDVKELVAKYYNVRIFGISRQMNMEISSRKIERPPDGSFPAAYSSLSLSCLFVTSLPPNFSRLGCKLLYRV